jgi:phosphatidylinositol alpha-1,6-mannosyltransferase
VIYAHGNEILEAIDSEWEKPRLALQGANCVLANSRFTAQLVERAGVRPEAIKVIPLGCNTEKYRPREPNPQLRERILGHRLDDFIILSVGKLTERKGQDMVIRALPAVRKALPGVTYVIVGDGPFKQDLEGLASSLNVRDHIFFAGKVSDGELPDFYALCDVFTMPSRARLDFHDVEGFGLVFLEAGASGKPVVAGRSGGVEDAVVHGTTGLLVNPSNVEELTAALISLLTNPELRTKLGIQGRERVQREFTWDIVGAHVQEILAQVAARNRQ